MSQVEHGEQSRDIASISVDVDRSLQSVNERAAKRTAETEKNAENAGAAADESREPQSCGIGVRLTTTWRSQLKTNKKKHTI